MVHDSNSCSRAEPDHKAVEEGGEFGSHIQQSVSSTTCLGWLIRPVEHVLQKQMQGQAGSSLLQSGAKRVNFQLDEVLSMEMEVRP